MIVLAYIVQIKYLNICKKGKDVFDQKTSFPLPDTKLFLVL